MASYQTAVQPFLEGVEFPVTKLDLIGHAESRGASNEVIEDLQALPGEQYESADEVAAAMRGREG
jgi:hypothetical protein